jgi:hypothetical protein
MRRAGTVLAVALLTLAAGVAGAAGASTASDQELARAGVLRLSDFPAGWKESRRGSTDDAAIDAQAAKISSCQRFAAFIKANKQNPRATSLSFDQANSNVTNAVSVFPSTEKAHAAMATFADARVPKCFEQLFTAVFRAQLTKTKSLAKQLASVKTHIGLLNGVHIGDQAIVYQGAVNVALKDGTTQTVGLGVISVRVGATLAGYSYTSDVDVSTALQPAIVASVVRVQNAHGPHT